MTLTILTDSDVRAILLSLKKNDIHDLQRNLAEALHEYSTGTQDAGCCSSYQPQRTVVKKKNGMTTLFMPASSGSLSGVKIVSLSEGSGSSGLKAPAEAKLPTSTTSETATLASQNDSISSMSSKLDGITLTSPPTTSSDAASISGSSFQAPSTIDSTQSTTPKGAITLLDSVGNPKALMNAEELTAFRTALAATLLMQKRHNVHTITVFGAGKQAYWHIRLALLLRPNEIHHVNIINRSFDRAKELLRNFYDERHTNIRGQAKFTILSSEFGEYGRVLKDHVRKADAIFCCTPSLEPLFPAEFLTSHEGRRKGRFISAIGSYKPHMTELHPDILRKAVEPEHHHHHHKHANQGGVIIVDSLEACMKEAGEVIQAGLSANHLVEIGELMMVKRAAQKEIELGGKGEKGLVDWLTHGNVIFKSVGLGLMDVVVGGDVVELAHSRDVGTRIDDF